MYAITYRLQDINKNMSSNQKGIISPTQSLIHGLTSDE